MENIIYPKVEIKQLAFKSNSEYIDITAKKAIVNPETDEIFTIVGDDYDIVAHEDVAKLVGEAAHSFPEYGNPTTQITLINGGVSGKVYGSKMAIKVQFEKIQHNISKNKAVGDYVNPVIHFFNSYDQSWALKGIFGAFRLVCSNGMVIGEKFAHYRKEHHQNASIDDLRNVIQVGMTNYSERVELWKGWLDIILDDKTKTDIIDDMGFNKTETEEITELQEEASHQTVNDTINKWIFVNILTQYITHHVKSDLKKIKLQDKLGRLTQ